MIRRGLTKARIDLMVQRVQVATRDAIIRETTRLTATNQQKIAAVFGEDAPVTRYVDGVEGKPLDQVNPHGYTVTDFDLYPHIITATWEALYRASPVGPGRDGHYKDDHWLFVNGERRDAATEGEKIVVKSGDDIVFLNARPYARKIEGGARSRFSRRMSDRRPGLSMQAPNGVYEITMNKLKRQFGNIATFRFTYRGLVGGAPALPSGPRKPGTRRGNRPAQNVSANRFPAIEIQVR